MRPFLLALVAFLAAAGPVGLSAALADTTRAEAPAPDYAAPAAWLCRPGADTACTTGLDALVVAADGTRTPQPFVAATDPKIDCFYVYPTVSQEPAAYADMAASPEIVHTAKAQAGRLASRCRLFAPLYRQMTLAGLRVALDKKAIGPSSFDGPYQDVVAAWRQYLAHDNHGRGVVLIGHSQGTILLQRLIAEEIDGKPAQRRLVSAFLAGDPALGVPQGASVGGTFKHIPLCTAAAQTGCAYAWGSYADDDARAPRLFGKAPVEAGQVAACVDPAAPGGGKGMLKAYLPKPAMAPPADPPFVEAIGQLSAACVADENGNALRISTEPSPFAELLRAMFAKVGPWPGWGLHSIDLALTQGNILDMIDAETAAWRAR